MNRRTALKTIALGTAALSAPVSLVAKPLQGAIIKLPRYREKVIFNLYNEYGKLLVAWPDGSEKKKETIDRLFFGFIGDICVKEDLAEGGCIIFDIQNKDFKKWTKESKRYIVFADEKKDMDYLTRYTFGKNRVFNYTLYAYDHHGCSLGLNYIDLGFELYRGFLD